MQEFWDQYDKIAKEASKKNSFDLEISYMEMAELAVDLLRKLEEMEEQYKCRCGVNPFCNGDVCPICMAEQMLIDTGFTKDPYEATE